MVSALNTIDGEEKNLVGYLVLQTTENDLVKQTIVAEHMRNHYRRLHGARCTNELQDNS